MQIRYSSRPAIHKAMLALAIVAVSLLSGCFHDSDSTIPMQDGNTVKLPVATSEHDNYSISDVNGNDWLNSLKQAQPDDRDTHLVVYELTVITTDGNHAIKGVARRGDTIRIEGEGFGTEPQIVWQQGSKFLKFAPQNDKAGVLTFTVPENAETGLIKVSDGKKISYPESITVVNSDSPLLFDVITQGGKSYAYAGETLTLQGINLNARNTKVKINGMELVPTYTSETSIQVVVPHNGASGMIAVVNNGISNWLPIEVRQQTHGRVILPTGSALSLEQLTAEFLGSVESPVAADGTFALPTRNQGPTTIHLFTPDAADRDPAIFLSAVVLPGQTSVTISPYTMAAGLVYTSMGLEATIHRDDQFAVMEVLLASTKAFGDYLNEKLGQDPYYLKGSQRDDFVDAYLKAIETAGKAIDAALEHGQLRRARTKAASRAPRSLF